MDGLGAAERLAHSVNLLATIRVFDRCLSVSDGDRGDGVDADKGAGVILRMIVGTFHEGTLRIEVSQSHINAYWCVKVCQNRSALGCIFKSFHIPLPLVYCSDKSLHPCRLGH